MTSSDYVRRFPLNFGFVILANVFKNRNFLWTILWRQNRPNPLQPGQSRFCFSPWNLYEKSLSSLVQSFCKISKDIISENSRFISDSVIYGFLQDFSMFVCLFCLQVYNRNCRVTRTFVGFFGIQILKLFVKNLAIIPNSPINLENSNDSQYFVQRSINPIVYTYRFQLKNSQSQFFLKNHFQKNENHDINFSQSEKKSDKWMITNYDWKWKWR